MSVCKYTRVNLILHSIERILLPSKRMSSHDGHQRGNKSTGARVKIYVCWNGFLLCPLTASCSRGFCSTPLWPWIILEASAVSHVCWFSVFTITKYQVHTCCIRNFINTDEWVSLVWHLQGCDPQQVSVQVFRAEEGKGGSQWKYLRWTASWCLTGGQLGKKDGGAPLPGSAPPRAKHLTRA